MTDSVSGQDPAARQATRAPAGASAGAMLRALRESAGVHVSVLASALKVSVQKLEALEADRLDQLPDVTFARGLASAVCRAFGADPAPVLERMPVQSSGTLAPVRTVNEPFRRVGDRPANVLASSFSRPVLIAIVLLLAAAAVLWLLPTLPIQLSLPGVGSSSEPTSREIAAPLPVPAVEPMPPTGAEAPMSAEAAAPAAAAAAASPGAGAGRALAERQDAPLLQLVATGESWVTVRDAAGKQLVNRAVQAGETLNLAGEVPLAVTVGRKDAMTVSVRGKPFDHRSLGPSSVARFEVK